MNSFLGLRGLRQVYEGRTVLDVAELDVREREIFAVIGPNGSGKSTLLRLVDLLEKPAGGDIVYWDGSWLSGLSRGGRKALIRQMALVFQEPLLFRRSVMANVSYGLKARRVEREEARRRASDALAMLGLQGFERRYAPTLSGGEAQKVSLARALAVRPRLLLLDEPFASLDPPTRVALRSEVAVLLRSLEMTALYVTHDHLEALQMADRIAVLIGGRIRQVGAPVEVFSSPASREVADFIGAETLLEGEVASSRGGIARVSVGGQAVEVMSEMPPGRRVLVMVHPEEVTLTGCGEAPTSARNRFEGVVAEVALLGALVKVRLDCGFPLVSYITRASREELGIREGMRACGAFKATAVHVIPHP